MKKRIQTRNIIVCCLVFLLVGGLTACKSVAEAPPAQADPQAPEAEPPPQNQTGETSPAAAPTTAAKTEPEAEDVAAAWQSSAHANSFVTDASGNNNTCARCHAPANWMPSMADLPESCYSCKFELEDPPAFIPEAEWSGVACAVCHPVDKQGQVKAEIAWLEIPPLEEYAKVATTTELCLKCHAPGDIPGHQNVEVGGAHAGYECTDCHSTHAAAASCDSAGCHANIWEPDAVIAGHDENHSAVACVACHDGSGMEVGPDAETGVWTTYAAGPEGSDPSRFPFSSHNVAAAAACDRCHFADNPWGLSTPVGEP